MVPSGQIGSAWEWYHWIGLEKDINRFRVLIFWFHFEYLKRLHSCEPHCSDFYLPIGRRTFICWKNRLRGFSILVWMRAVGIFYSRAVIQRTIVVFPAFLEHGAAVKIAVSAHTNRYLNKQVVGIIFEWSCSELFQKFITILKNQKPIAVDDFSKAYPIYHSHADSIWPDGTFMPLASQSYQLWGLCVSWKGD